MTDYAVYGGFLRSTTPIPELRAVADVASPSWFFEKSSDPPPLLDSPQRIGEDQVFDGIRATLLRAENMLRLQFDDTGTFDVRERTTRIVWYEKPDCQLDVARADLIGRVLPLALHERGFFALHASAVRMSGNAIAFMAPKNYGKSSLAMSLVTRHAAGLLTDDTLIVAPSDGIAVPGVHSVRLWRETAARFDGLGAGRRVLSEKQIFEELPETSLALTETPLDSVYTIVPAAADASEAARRERLDGAGATIALIQYQKLGALLGGPEAARVFERAAALATRCSIYALHVARDFARLGAAATTIAQWHTR
jgi:hypothetical protein